MKKIALTVITLFLLTQSSFGQLDLKQIMTGNDFIGNSPESFHWSLDGQSIYFYWNPENNLGSSLYQFDLKSKQYRKLLDSVAVNVVFHDPNQAAYQQQVMSDEGVLWSIDKKDGSRKIHLQTTNGIFNVQRTSNPDQVIFQQGNQVYSYQLKTGSLRQLTNFVAVASTKAKKDSTFLERQQSQLFEFIQEKNAKNAYYEEQAKNLRFPFPKEQVIGSADWGGIQVDPSMNYALFRISEGAEGKATNVEQFVTNDGFTKHQPAREKVSDHEPNQKMGLYQLKKDSLIWLDFSKLTDIRLKPAYLREKETVKLYEKDRSIFIHAAKFANSKNLALCDVRTSDNKDRWIVCIDLTKATVKELEHQHDEAWIGGPGISSWNEEGGNMDWIIDGQSFYFQSEESGYSKLYAFDLLSDKKSCMMPMDKIEVYQAQLAKDHKSFYIEYTNCQTGFTGNHSFGRLDIGTTKLVPYAQLGKGFNEVLISPNETHLAVRQSFGNKPWEMYVKENNPTKSDLLQITHSTSEAFESYRWIDPKVISFKGSDGMDVFARIYEPEAAKKNGAAVLFVHGAGYLQNAHHYWSNYYREYMFHHLLSEQGYTVLDVDYRASEGYGRDYRTAIYRHMGGRDLEDFIDAKAFMVKNYGIDAKRVGMYGGSYGGFITLMGLLTKPNEFACGAALRSVTDWAHYNHEYTSNILNYPETDPEAYRKSSPIYFAENLQDPLLMLHGMVDDNVQFQDVVRLSQRFIELGKKDWDLAVYPVEAHGFKEAYSWYDEYRRILELMEKNLK
ncbi:MAG: prolyl oligopeptidase family serine peptidase [Flavobacteriia bacterium]